MATSDPYSQIFSQVSQQGVSTGQQMIATGDTQQETQAGALVGGFFDPSQSMSLISSAKEKNKQVALEDARQKAFLADINEKRRKLGLGLDYAYQEAQTRARQNLAQTQQNMLRGSRDVATAQQGLNIAQQNYGTQMNQAAVPLLAQESALMQMSNQQIDKLAQRKLDLEMFKNLTSTAQMQKQQQSMDANRMGTIASMIGSMGGDTTTSGVPTQQPNATTQTQPQTAPDYLGTPLVERNSGIPFSTQYGNYVQPQQTSYSGTPFVDRNSGVPYVNQPAEFNYNNLYNQPNKYITSGQ